ncbi:hypothetical protein, partial [Streptococcus equinus]
MTEKIKIQEVLVVEGK